MQMMSLLKNDFLGQVKGLTDSELKAVKESAKEFKNKLSLEETIPEELAKGKKLKKQKVKEIKDEFGKFKSKGLGLTLDQKHIENISVKVLVYIILYLQELEMMEQRL